MAHKPSLKVRAANLLMSLGNSLARKSAFSFGTEISGIVNAINLGGMRISTDSFYTIWRNHGDVFAAIRELTSNVGAAGYYWENVNDNTQEPDAAEVNAIETLFAKSISFRKLKQELVKDQHISGNSYILIQKGQGSGKPIGLQIIDPRTLTCVTDKYGKILKWIQKVGANAQDFNPDEIIHWKLINDPNSPVFGLSPLEPIVWEVRTDLSAMVSNYAFFQNDAQPAAQYILEEGMGDDEAQRAIDALQNQLKGSENRHKSVVMKGVKEVKQLTISQKDMEFHVLRRFTTEKVCAALGVPKSILNYTEDVNLANGEEQTQKFWEGTIIPLQEELAEFVNKQLLPALGIQNIKLCFNFKTFDAKDQYENSTRADLMLGVLTINEVREARGFEKYDAAQVGEYVDQPLLYSGYAVRPLEDVGTDLMDEETPIPADIDSNQSKLFSLIKSIAERQKYAKRVSARARK